jgi:hypothetical protein
MSMPIKNDLIDIYNKMSNEDKVFMIELMRKDIVVPVMVTIDETKKRCVHMHLCEEVPVFLNGVYIDINLEDTIKIKDGDFI